MSTPPTSLSLQHRIANTPSVGDASNEQCVGDQLLQQQYNVHNNDALDPCLSVSTCGSDSEWVPFNTISWNMCNAGGNKFRRSFDALDFLQPEWDVVFIQECLKSTASAESFETHSFRAHKLFLGPSRGSGAATAILVNGRSTAEAVFSSSSTCSISVELGTRMLLVSAYLRPRAHNDVVFCEALDVFAAEVTKFRETHKATLFGVDANTQAVAHAPHNGDYANAPPTCCPTETCRAGAFTITFVEASITAVITFVDLGPTWLGHASARQRPPPRTLDYVLLGAKVHASAAWIPEEYEHCHISSDHRPVVCTWVVLRGPRPRRRARTSCRDDTSSRLEPLYRRTACSLEQRCMSQSCFRALLAVI